MSIDPAEGRALAVAPIRESLQLGDYFPNGPEQAFLESNSVPAGFLSYEWHDADNFETAVRRIKQTLLAAQTGLPAPFFAKAVLDMYNFDRALYAAHKVGAEPVRRRAIPDWLWEKPLCDEETAFQDVDLDNPREIKDLVHKLIEETLEWNAFTPGEAVDSAGILVESEPPDRFWMAWYHMLGADTKYRPITDSMVIYAQYGEWHVEVARWG